MKPGKHQRNGANKDAKTSDERSMTMPMLHLTTLLCY